MKGDTVAVSTASANAPQANRLFVFRRDDLSKMPYLTMCIKEALRCHVPVPFIQRELTQDTEIDGCIAPAGTVINIIIYNIHHNPAIWEDSLVSVVAVLAAGVVYLRAQTCLPAWFGRILYT